MSREGALIQRGHLQYLKGALISFVNFWPQCDIFFISSECNFKNSKTGTYLSVEIQICVCGTYLHFAFNVLLPLSSRNPTNPLQFLYCYPQALSKEEEPHL